MERPVSDGDHVRAFGSYRGILSLVVWGFACSAACGAATPVIPIALDSDQAPGAPAGATYSLIGSVQGTNTGQFFFDAALGGGVADSGIWSWSADKGLTPVAVAGTNLPGIPQGPVSNLQLGGADAQGNVLFSAKYS